MWTSTSVYKYIALQIQHTICTSKNFKLYMHFMHDEHRAFFTLTQSRLKEKWGSKIDFICIFLLIIWVIP